MKPSLDFWGVYGALASPNEVPFHIDFYTDGELDLMPFFREAFRGRDQSYCYYKTDLVLYINSFLPTLLQFHNGLFGGISQRERRFLLRMT